MTPQDFCYWLKGYFEINGEAKITPKQAQIIKDHLDLVFEKVTPDRATFEPTKFEKQTDPPEEKIDWMELGGAKEIAKELEKLIPDDVKFCCKPKKKKLIC
jgi:hypothetical protein